MELGYWPFKGAAEPIRYVLGYVGAAYTEYNPETREAWGEKKPTLAFDFPNLPYLKDGEYYLSESGAIPVYIAHKANRSDLVGKDGKDQAIVRQIQGVLGDIKDSVSKIIWAGAAVDKVLAADGSVVTKINALSKFLGEKDYFLGYVTLADIEFTALSHFFSALVTSLEQADSINAHANLKALVHRVSGLPGIKERITAAGDLHFAPPAYLKFKLLTWNEYLSKTSA